MDIASQFGYLLLGVIGLFWGAEWLVKGSADIAFRLGVSPLVIGLTVIAFGTSSPELIVCVNLNLSGNAEMAVGNIVGSNICNIALIIGVGALLRPLSVHREVVRRDAPFLLGASLIFLWMLRDGELSRLEGVALTAGVIFYTFICFRGARARHAATMDEAAAAVSDVSLDAVTGDTGETRARSLVVILLMIVAGFALLVGGAHFLKTGAVSIAQAFGVSEAIIGLSLVALGTSLPEFAATMVASLRREGDLIMGNAIGSCIFNLFAVMGITQIVKPMHVTQIEPSDLLVMLALTAGLLVLVFVRKRLTRLEGVIFLAVYAAYCGFLFMRTDADVNVDSQPPTVAVTTISGR